MTSGWLWPRESDVVQKGERKRIKYKEMPFCDEIKGKLWNYVDVTSERLLRLCGPQHAGGFGDSERHRYGYEYFYSQYRTARHGQDEDRKHLCGEPAGNT